ncbi:MAG: thioredoxin domain-containing protein [Bdellovibrionales bacterium]|nr:thioredoxin domain-containing protein [Bdellovibrionales bacterium]
MKKFQYLLSSFIVGAWIFGCDNSVSNESGHSEAKTSAVSESTTPQASSSGSSEELVKVGDKVITESDLVSNLKGRAKGQLFKAKADYFEAQQNVVDSYLFDYLVEQEAKGKSVDELLKKEIDGKIKKVSDKDVQKFYDDFKAQASKMNRPIPPLSDDIKQKIREQLEGDKKAERRNAYFDQLKKKYKVTYLASPPRMEIATGDMPVRGSKNAPVTIVEFSDFECPYCQRGASTIEKIVKSYKGKVKLYFRDFPLGFHPHAKPAAVAARCAADQGKFWEYHDVLFEDQKGWLEKAKKGSNDQEPFIEIAKKLKLKEADFKKCVESGDKLAMIEKDMAVGADAGITGTPAFFVNGIPLFGALPEEKFKEVIDKELKRESSASKSSILP